MLERRHRVLGVVTRPAAMGRRDQAVPLEERMRRRRSHRHSIRSSPGRSPILVLQDPFVELAGRVKRQLGAEVDHVRALDVGELLAAVRQQLARQSRRGIVVGGHLDRLDHRLDLLAEVFVGNTEHGVHHLRVRHEHVLRLLRVDVDAAGDDEKRLAVGEVEVVVGVEVADVAERRPAPGVARTGGLLGVVVVLDSLPPSK